MVVVLPSGLGRRLKNRRCTPAGSRPALRKGFTGAAAQRVEALRDAPGQSAFIASVVVIARRIARVEQVDVQIGNAGRHGHGECPFHAMAGAVVAVGGQVAARACGMRRPWSRRSGHVNG
jgi:hypothetical protein